jgi:hypothetical protein
MKVENKNFNSWFNYEWFYRLIALSEEYSNFSTFIEVGVWEGMSISYLATLLKPRFGRISIYAVDLFDQTHVYKDNHKINTKVPNIKEVYNNNLVSAGVRDMIFDIQGVSWEVSSDFEEKSVDFVFLDAGHDYDSICKDLLSWSPKIKSGGVLSGHDYKYPDVMKAVNEFYLDNKDLFISPLKTGPGGVWFLAGRV